MFSHNLSSIRYFHKTLFDGSLEISLSTGRNVSRGKVAYNWISPDPAKAEPTLGVVVVVIVVPSGLLCTRSFSLLIQANTC